MIGDKFYKVKVISIYMVDWEGVFGVYFVFQLGEVWIVWDGMFYGYLFGISCFVEFVGSCCGVSYWQVDLNYI